MSLKPPFLYLAIAMTVAASAVSAQTTPATTSPKAQYAAEAAQAKARYTEDLKICDDSPSQARMQCKRDAKLEYDNALKAAKAHTGVDSKQSAPEPAACADCGKVISVTQTEKEGEGSAVGLIAGGLAGAVLGHQVGGGFGKDLATIAGAAGGAYAGREVEKRTKSHQVWTVSVRYPDGQTHSYDFAQNPGFRVGDAVRKADNTIKRP